MLGLVTKLFHIASRSERTRSSRTAASRARTPSTADEREQYFSNSLHPELYGDPPRGDVDRLGAGVAITDQLSVGAAFILT